MRVQRSAAEQLYLMNCVFGVEITTTDSGKKGVRVLSVRCVCTVVCVPVCARACVCGYCGLMGHWRSVGGPANLAGITDEDFIKEIDGVHRTRNRWCPADASYCANAHAHRLHAQERTHTRTEIEPQCTVAYCVGDRQPLRRPRATALCRSLRMPYLGT